MILFQVGVVSLLVGGALGFGLARLRAPLDPMREHARYLRKARRAYLMRQPGLANIYEEAAERVLPGRKELAP